MTESGVYLAPTAVLTGDVTAGEGTSFWFGAVVRGDVAAVRFGRRVNVQDNAVVHCDTDVQNEIADDVTIGHGAIVHGSAVGRGSLVGMAATLLSQTRVGDECLIAAGAVLSPGTVVPDRMVAMGVPAKIVRPVSEKGTGIHAWLTTHYVELAASTPTRITAVVGCRSDPLAARAVALRPPVLCDLVIPNEARPLLDESWFDVRRVSMPLSRQPSLVSIWKAGSLLVSVRAAAARWPAFLACSIIW
jgi:carbonic anhydrase/acetyltransferase-like protein (isoleucine patch superfamily)